MIQLPYEIIKHEIYKHSKQEYKYKLKSINKDMYENGKYMYENKYFEIENGIVESIKNNDIDILKFLIKNHKNICIQEFHFIMCCMSENCNLEIYKLLEKMVDYEMELFELFNLSIISAEFGNTEIFGYLIGSYFDRKTNITNGEIGEYVYFSKNVDTLKLLINICECKGYEIDFFGNLSYEKEGIIAKYEFLKNNYVHKYEKMMKNDELKEVILYDFCTYIYCKHSNVNTFKYFSLEFPKVYEKLKYELLNKAIFVNNCDIYKYISNSIPIEDCVKKCESIKQYIFSDNYITIFKNNKMFELVCNDINLDIDHFIEYYKERQQGTHQLIIEKIFNDSLIFKNKIISAHIANKYKNDEKILSLFMKNKDILNCINSRSILEILFGIEYFDTLENVKKSCKHQIISNFKTKIITEFYKQKKSYSKYSYCINKEAESEKLKLLNWSPYLDEIMDFIDCDFVEWAMHLKYEKIVKWAIELKNLEITNGLYFKAIHWDCIGSLKYLLDKKYINENIIEKLLIYASKYQNFEAIKLLYNKNIPDKIIKESFKNIVENIRPTIDLGIEYKEIQWMSKTKYKKYFSRYEKTEKAIPVYIEYVYNDDEEWYTLGYIYC